MIYTVVANMAFSRKEVIRNVRGLQRPINLHLIKLLKWEDKVNFEKHIRDLDTWLLDIKETTVKPKGDNLKADKYFELLYEEPLTPEKVFNSTLNVSLSEYHNLKVIKTDEQVYKAIKSIHLSLSSQLSNFQFRTIRDLIILHTK